MKSNEIILAEMGMVLYDHLQYAEYECRHANDSHTSANANGKKTMITAVVENFYSKLDESEDAQKVRDMISDYEKKCEEYNRKVSIIVEASDYALCEGGDDAEIEEIISDLESAGVEIIEENRDIIIEYIMGEEDGDGTDEE